MRLHVGTQSSEIRVSLLDPHCRNTKRSVLAWAWGRVQSEAGTIHLCHCFLLLNVQANNLPKSKRDMSRVTSSSYSSVRGVEF